MKDRQEKLFDAITLIDDGLILEADRSGAENGELIKRRWKNRILWRIIVLVLLSVLFCCVLLFCSDEKSAFKTGWEAVPEFDGTEKIEAAGLPEGGLWTPETNAGQKGYPAGQKPPVSPIQDNSAVKKLAVYRSLRAESSEDTCRYLENWAEDMKNRAKALGMELQQDGQGIMQNGEPYLPEQSEGFAGPLYLTFTCGNALLQPWCASEGGVTYCSLNGLEEFYQGFSGEEITVKTKVEAEQKTKDILRFLDDLLGTSYSNAAFVIDETEGEGLNANAYYWSESGSSMSRTLLTFGDSGMRGMAFEKAAVVWRKNTDGCLFPARIKINNTCRRYIGEYELIRLEEAEENLAAGYYFGGILCPECRKTCEAIDFTEFDLVQIEYCGHLAEYVLPCYVFYKFTGQKQYSAETEIFPETDGLADEYAVVYVPAVKTDGLKDLFAALVKEHKAGAHGSP